MRARARRQVAVEGPTCELGSPRGSPDLSATSPVARHGDLVPDRRSTDDPAYLLRLLEDVASGVDITMLEVQECERGEQRDPGG